MKNVMFTVHHHVTDNDVISTLQYENNDMRKKLICLYVNVHITDYVVMPLRLYVASVNQT